MGNHMQCRLLELQLPPATSYALMQDSCRRRYCARRTLEALLCTAEARGRQTISRRGEGWQQRAAYGSESAGGIGEAAGPWPVQTSSVRPSSAGCKPSRGSFSPRDWLDVQLQRLAIVSHQHEHVWGPKSASVAASARRPCPDAAKAARRLLLPILLVCVRGTAERQHRGGCRYIRSMHCQ